MLPVSVKGHGDARLYFAHVVPLNGLVPRRCDWRNGQGKLKVHLRRCQAFSAHLPPPLRDLSLPLQEWSCTSRSDITTRALPDSSAIDSRIS